MHFLLFAASEVPPEYMGYMVMATLLLLGGAVAIKTLLTKPVGTESVSRTEYNELKRRCDDDHDQMANFVQRTELANVVREVKEQHNQLSELVNDLRVGQEQTYRAINHDVQEMIGKLMEHVDSNHRAVLACFGSIPRSKGSAS